MELTVIPTEQVARLLDVWRAERDGREPPDPPLDPRRRRDWLTRATHRMLDWGVSPLADRRSGSGQRLWVESEVMRACRLAPGRGNWGGGPERSEIVRRGWATRRARARMGDTDG